jgi:hypothetical protein
MLAFLLRPLLPHTCSKSSCHLDIDGNCLSKLAHLWVRPARVFEEGEGEQVPVSAGEGGTVTTAGTAEGWVGLSRVGSTSGGLPKGKGKGRRARASLYMPQSNIAVGSEYVLSLPGPRPVAYALGWGGAPDRFAVQSVSPYSPGGLIMQ